MSSTESYIFTPLQLEWLDALESGKFPQGKNKLISDDGYCCLGVACEILGFKRVYNNFIDANGKIMSNSLAHNNYKELGLRSPFGDFKGCYNVDGEFYNSLSNMNDAGMSFRQISRYIRDNPTNVFM